MKAILLLLFVFSITSCSLKEAIDNNFETESKVTPFAKSKSLKDLYGDKIKIKIPLTESSMGYYEVEDILENKDKNAKKKDFFHRIYDRFRLGLYRLAIKLGVSNNIRYTTYYDFDAIDADYLESATVTKVFFTTEECRPEEQDCNGSKKITTNFNFVETFFVNVSNYSKEETEGALEFIPAKDFEEMARRSFEQSSEDIKDEEEFFSKANKSGHWTQGDSSNLEASEINLVRFANDVPEIDIKESDLPKNGKKFTFKLKRKQDMNRVEDYLEKRKTLKKFIKRVTRNSRKREVTVVIKRGVSIKEVFHAIMAEQPKKYTSKMVIFRLNSKLIETNKYFKQEKFAGIIQDSTMIGRSYFVELVSNNKRDDLDRILKRDKDFVSKELDIYKVEECDKSNCLDLGVKEFNLVPMLARNPKLQIDSYISVKSLGKEDFKYNGFIEVEIKLSLPD